MSDPCKTHCCAPVAAQTPRYRKVLWFALCANFAMFAAEVVMSQKAGSVSLLADSLDFFGDAANYGISLFVLAKALSLRARASLLKGWTMAVFGLWVLAATLWNAFNGVLPKHTEMGVIGLLALLTNVAVAWALYAYREGDSNMQSVWLCSRNDAIGNIAVMLAAVAVFLSSANWPDLLVAVLMAALSLQAAWVIIRRAGSELRRSPAG